MKRNAILCALLTAAACGPKGTKTTTPIGAGSGSGSDVVGTGSGSGSAETPPPPPAPPDPNLPARVAYSDPGGMWLPRQMTLPQHVANFKALGVEMDPKTLSNPLDAPLAAVVWLGGCTGSFVSPDGLIVTNHHCAQGALQFNATPDHNYVEDGFLAKTRADEKSAGPTQHVQVAQAIRDVTKTMTDGLDKIKDPIKRKKESEKREKDLVAACEKDHPEVRCEIYAHFRGAEYQLIEYLDIKDVRLVYAPKRTVGDYGGEVDNWHWPRHTGDWSFFRAYVGKDGKPAAFAADNVPYKPAHWLKVSTEGVENHDFVMVAGYPGRTSRLDTASEVHFDVDQFYPYLIDYLQARYDLAGKVLETAKGDTMIKTTVAKQFIQNALAKYQGVLAGMKKGDMIKRKDDLDAKVKAWAAEKGHEGYKKAIDKLEKLIAEDHKTWRADFDFQATVGGSVLLRNAFTFVRMAEERPKKDADRKPGFQDRDLSRLVASQKSFARQYDRTLDRATFRLLLVRAMALPAKERPWLATIVGARRGAKIDEKTIDAALDKLYAGTKLEDEQTRLDLLQKASTKDLKKSKDPFIQVAVALWPTVKKLEDKSDRMTGERLLVAPEFADAMRQVLDGNLSPDANASLRVTYGTVKSLNPDSTAEADLPFTLAHQILTKDTGKDPFNAPAELLAAIKAGNFGPYKRPELGDLPVNFLSDLDITGGNSGSPTLNGKGELVGLAFDGNIEGVASDVVFNGAVTRTIHCDVRYMLWVMDAVDHADNVLREMGIKPQL